MVTYKFLKLQTPSPCPTVRLSKTFPITGPIQHSFLWICLSVPQSVIGRILNFGNVLGCQFVVRYSLTPTIKVLGKLIVSRLVIFPTFNGTRRSKILLFCHVTLCLEVSSSGRFCGLFQSSSSFLDCLILKVKALAAFEALAASRPRHGVTSQKSGIF